MNRIRPPLSSSSRAPGRRRWLRSALGLGVLGLPLVAARAADARPLRILVGFPAGGGTDAVARLLADRLKDELGAPVIVENKPGAGGQLAAQALKAAAPDGHTLMVSHDHTISILPQVVRQPGFDPSHDFVAAAGFASFVNSFAVSAANPARTVAEYVQWVRREGGGNGTVGVPAPASVPEFLVKLLGQKYSLDLQPVPYRGSAPLIGDMLGNQIAAGVGSVPEFIEHHRNGKLRILATLGDQRQRVLPEVPTFRELGLAGFEDVPYYGFFAPAGTSRVTLERFAAALDKVLAQREVRARLLAWGMTVDPMGPQQLAARERAYTQAWTRIIKASGFQPL